MDQKGTDMISFVKFSDNNWSKNFRFLHRWEAHDDKNPTDEEMKRMLDALPKFPS